MKTKNTFTSFASKIACWSGRPCTFLAAVGIILVWAITGPLFDYSDTWQLVINTGTTIITFLMVFLIQNTQTRDTKALQIKLDELIRVTEGAHTFLLDLEELNDKELSNIYEKYEEIARRSREMMRHGKNDTHKPDVKFEKIT
jgi:low affinity Fe/Cu permease